MPTWSDHPVRWGIVGTGGIAAAFAGDLVLLDDAEVVAVGSRNQETATEFASRLGIPRAHGTHDALVDDPEVDAVYVATPHPFHHEGALAAIRAGKPVLVEKPFTLNATQARQVVAAARSQRVFVMEAMWTRFLPHIGQLRELLATGRLGDVRSLTADLGGYAPPEEPEHRIFRPDLGGGGLLDIGVYLVSLSSMLFGTATRISAASHPTESGVDAQTAMILEHPAGRLSVLLTSIEANTPGRATITGTAARIEIDGPFFRPSVMRLIDRDGTVEVFEDQHEGLGLRHQAAEVARCLRASLPESPMMPLDESVSVMETLDEVRRQIGLVYPGEAASGPG